jgi:hypothetical protein
MPCYAILPQELAFPLESINASHFIFIAEIYRKLPDFHYLQQAIASIAIDVANNDMPPRHWLNIFKKFNL